MASAANMSNAQLLTYLKEIEEAAEDVLSDKQEIVDLDRKRNLTREALSAVDASCKSHWKGDDKKTWLAVGNCFFKLPNSTAKTMLRKDQVQLDSEINVIRSNLKVKVNRLREKEGRPELQGFGLQALSREEISAVRQVIGPAPAWR